MSAESVFELRQYTLRGGQRETLIAMFEREFVAPLNAAGAFVRGIFRDLDDPDRFVWLRAFADMRSRRHALEQFYNGAVWQRHRTQANATMIDSDNVLLLRVAGSALSAAPRPAADAGSAPVYSAAIHYLGDVSPSIFREFYMATIRPQLTAAGALPVLEAITETAENNYPRLPVREGENVFIHLARWSGIDRLRAFEDSQRSLSGWRDSAPPSLLPALMRKPEILRLAPSSASPLD